MDGTQPMGATKSTESQPEVYRGKSLIGFLDEHEADLSPSEGKKKKPPQPKPDQSAEVEDVNIPRDKHTFKVVAALTGVTITTLQLPLTPAPTVGLLQQHLQTLNHRGKLVQETLTLEDSDVIKLDPSGETQLSLIKGNYIEVKEAGYYNGVYEQMGQNEGRPAFKMVKSDHSSSGERYIYYSSKGGQIVPGWKFNDRYVPDISEWHMLAPGGPAYSGGPTDDIPEGKFRLDNGGTNTKPNAPRISKTLSLRSADDEKRLERKAALEEQENVEGTEPGGCFNGEALVLMADGTRKQACDVRVGDSLSSASSSCATTKVEAIIVEARDCHQLIQLGGLLITPHHPVVQDGHWVLPRSVKGARILDADIELYNFITSNREAIYVEDFVATSIGTFCEGLHDIEQNPEHRIWGTDEIVRIYQRHPQWPYIVSTTEDTIAAVDAVKAGAPCDGNLWRYCETCRPAKTCGMSDGRPGVMVESY